MLLLCTPKFTQTSIDVDKKKCLYSFEYQPASTNCQTPSIRRVNTKKYCLVHSPEKCSPVFGPNLCLLLIGTYGSELYGMESKDSRQVIFIWHLISLQAKDAPFQLNCTKNLGGSFSQPPPFSSAM